MTTTQPGTAAPPTDEGDPLLRIAGLVKHFPIRAGILQRQVAAVQAVDGLDFSARNGETFSIVGESRCGKTTARRGALLRQDHAGAAPQSEARAAQRKHRPQRSRHRPYPGAVDAAAAPRRP